ncbi:MAG: acyl--CoA ligase [Parasporobacterium sp.]|nr:acyl--CoA ligase [Parasporobacterium sp.]
MKYTYDATTFKKAFEQEFTWIKGFMRNVRRYPDNNAVIDPAADRVWTYKSLNEDVNRLANALVSGGVGESDVVFYQLYNTPQFVLSYIAPQKLGAINSPGNCNLSAGETARMIDRDRPKAYIYDSDIREMAAKAVEMCTYKPEMIICADCRMTRPEIPEGHIYFDELISRYGTNEPETDHIPDMYAENTRLGTSGTTGTPKGVPVNNVNEVMSAHDVIMHFPLSPRDVTMNMTPWHHRGGLHSGGPVPTLYVGACLVTMKMFSAKACFDYVEKYGITFLIGVPSALDKLAVRQEKHPADLSCLKGIVTMGSPLDRASAIRYQTLLTENIFNGYGTTETFWNSFLRPYDLPEMAGAAGQACTDDEVRIVNIYPDRKAEPDDLAPMDGTTQGEIIIKTLGKSSLCYYDNPEQTAEKYYRGWFYTKDSGTWDSKGFISVAGRRDDMIICMGENIYPSQVEEVILQHPKVSDCMVTGLSDPARGQVVVAYVIPSDPSLTVKEINNFCVAGNELSEYKCPKFYVFTDSLPYNSNGKKQHVILKQRAAEDKEKGLLRRP